MSEPYLICVAQFTGGDGVMKKPHPRTRIYSERAQGRPKDHQSCNAHSDRTRRWGTHFSAPIHGVICNLIQISPLMCFESHVVYVHMYEHTYGCWWLLLRSFRQRNEACVIRMYHMIHDTRTAPLAAWSTQQGMRWSH